MIKVSFSGVIIQLRGRRGRNLGVGDIDDGIVQGPSSRTSLV